MPRLHLLHMTVMTAMTGLKRAGEDYAVKFIGLAFKSSINNEIDVKKSEKIECCAEI
ncbi:hypothetical protein [Marinibactrum halimedae]|uniref:hypothetical protein n=1 Tax=Marinibactrum halimedae TaxID=1444977 RepID=UPI001E5E25E6|nr:hypothetical protein [Marinibactrum halimedae]MCD9461280.1 hypothetical protein [Marinibactrum halimedae]